jgi:hypothetical protein
MRFRYKLILSLTLTLIFGVVQAAYKRMSFRILRPPQPYSAARYYSPPPPPPPPTGPVNEAVPSRAYINYSNSGGEIRVGTSYIQLRGDLYDGLILMPSFTVKGKVLKPPKSVRLQFISYFTDTPFQSMTTLRIVGDDKLVFEGPLKIDSKSDATKMNPTMSEVAEVDMPYRLFERLCQSKSVELSTGDRAVATPEDAMLKFRDIKKQVDLRTFVQ